MRYVIIAVVIILAVIALLPLLTEVGRKLKRYFKKEIK